MQSEAKRYHNIKLAVGITRSVTSFILLFLFVLLGLSEKLEQYIRIYYQNDYQVLLLYVIVIGILSSIIFFPVSYYIDFYLEHKFDLSNQTFWKWIWENTKSTMVGSAIGIPILLVFYLILNTFGYNWWLPFALIMFLVSVLLAKILPVLILPIFYKVTPIEDESLKERIMVLSKNAGLNVTNVFKFNMSKNTKKANAAFTGLGKTKRILLGDTLLANYSNDEIETVIAHELGHYKKKHILKNVFISTIFSFLTFYLISKTYLLSLPFFGFSSITTISALPLLALWGLLIGLLITPISNAISRKFEYEADAYAIRTTNKREAFINTLDKLTDQNLGDREPRPIVEWFFYSHPSIKKRIQALQNIV
jgi:STE24 endopeptidase